MRIFKTTLCVIAVLLCTGLATDALANKAAITIEAPESAAPGTEITIRVTVTHNANNLIHHVNWVYIMINGKEAGRWEFGWMSLPEEVPFTRELRYRAAGPLEIKAEANCNIHGSRGPAYKKVMTK
jgi:desulfoferrodoxin (superoxide reductase-like protein)